MAGMQTEKVRNDKLLVVEQTLVPGEALSLPGERAGVVVYLDAGSVEIAPPQEKPRTETVKRGEAVFQPPQAGTVKNAGSAVLRIVWTEYLGKGGSETWGSAGPCSELQGNLRKPVRAGLRHSNGSRKKRTAAQPS